uniref:Uncharacterized protein n=1 Tax=Plectus sambesii TaxID=2011161 RepID=A0A914WPY3_9BILA
MTDSEGEESFLGEILIGGAIFKINVFPVGRTYSEMKKWAFSKAGKEHRRSSIQLIKFQRYHAKFDQYVDCNAEPNDRPKDGWKIRIILPISKAVYCLHSEFN